MQRKELANNKILELTKSEAKTALLYIEKSIIDAEGLLAIGVGSRTSVDNLKSIKRKLAEKERFYSTPDECYILQAVYDMSQFTDYCGESAGENDRILGVYATKELAVLEKEKKEKANKDWIESGEVRYEIVPWEIRKMAERENVENEVE